MDKLKLVSIEDLFESINHGSYTFARLIALYREWKVEKQKAYFKAAVSSKDKGEVVELLVRTQFPH